MDRPKTVPADGTKVTLAALHHAPMDISAVVNQVKQELGLTLGYGDPTHGYIHTYHKKAGMPFVTIKKTGELDREIDSCPKCESVIPRQDEHWCNEVVLYDEDKDSNDTPDKAVVHLRKSSLDKDGMRRLRQIISAHGGP